MDEKSKKRLDSLIQACGEKTAAFFTPPKDDFDPSSLLVAYNNGDNQGRLFMPAFNRWAWFRIDHPNAVVVPMDPVINGRMVTVSCQVYLNPDDATKGNIFCRGACSGVFTDDPNFVNSLRTRALGNAMRNAGYDMPLSAHFIEGWTEIIGGPADSAPEEAMESGAKIIPMIPVVNPAPNPNHAESSAPVPANETPVSAAPVVPPTPVPDDKEQENPVSASQSENTADSPTPSRPVRSRKREKKPESSTDPIQQPPQDGAMEKGKDEPAEVSAPKPDIPAVEPASEQKSSEEQAADFNQDIYQRQDVVLLLKEAEECFPGNSAEEYQHVVFSNKKVGEQGDLRVAYFAKKAIAGESPERKLGLATLLVARNRGLKL